MVERLIISPPKGARHKKKRLGRGESSGHGKTCCRGGKGQTARAGKKLRPGFEGGQMPLIRRIPKSGFKNYFSKDVQIVNVWQLDKKFDANEEIGLTNLESAGLINLKKSSKNQFVKILGSGEISKPLKVSAHFFSKSAIEKIKKAGGDILKLSPEGKTNV